MKKVLIDLTGQKFGRLTVVCRAPSRVTEKGTYTYWECLCDCGTVKEVSGSNLQTNTFSCGCLHRETRKTCHLTHGLTHTRVFRIWHGMKERCLNPKSTVFKNYGGRGITVCNRWLESVENFVADMGHPPISHSIERKNNNGNYEPGNCIWATRDVQNNNQRSNIRVDWKGQSLTLVQVARLENKTYDGILYHFHRTGTIAGAVASAQPNRKQKA